MATNILVTQLTKVRVYWNNNLLNMNCILLFTLLVSYNQAHQGSYGKKTKGLEICVNGLGNRKHGLMNWEQGSGESLK